MSLELLDYGKPSPFGATIGKPRNLAWPVYVYRVTIPKSSNDDDAINPFERIVLKLIETSGTREPEALAMETCVPIDLIKCILLRLQGKAFIDEQNQIIEERRKNWKNTEETPSTYVTALFFRELVTGRIMPFYHQLDEHNPLIKKEKNGIKKLRYSDDHKGSFLTPRDIIEAIRLTKKRSLAFGKEIRLPKVQQITIVNDPELHYLDCPIAIQKNDGEFRIADPFGSGFSLVLENSFNRLIEKDEYYTDWLMKWKQDLSNPDQSKQTDVVKEPFDNETNQLRYPKLVANLRARKGAQHRTINQIYAVLEWTLFYVTAQRSFEASLKELRLENQIDHPNLLKRATEAIGLNMPKSGFQAVRAGKLDDFITEKANMEAVLALSLLMAESEHSHPLRNIAIKFPDFINKIEAIRPTRNDKSHGKGKIQRHDTELEEERFMRDVITTLLPSVRFSSSPLINKDQNIEADLRLDSRASIQNEFGFRLFNRLGEDLQERLIHIERYWLLTENHDNAQTLAFDAYAAVQKAFSQKQQQILAPELKDSELHLRSQENASQAGLGKLPKSIRTVKCSAIRRTLQGDDQTLGACIISFLILTDGETLKSVAQIQPSLISDVADIITKRGHGNEPLPLPKADIGKLRKSTYLTIKTLLEI